MTTTYRDFNITPAEYGGFQYEPACSEGGNVMMIAGTIEDAKKEIDATIADRLELTARVTTGDSYRFNITKFDNIAKAEQFLERFGKPFGFIHYYQNGQPYYNSI